MENFEIIRTLVLLLVSGFATILWFLFRDVKKMAEKTKDEFNKYQVDIGAKLGTYVTQHDLAQTIQTFTHQLNAVRDDIRADIQRVSDRFSDKLEKKADKE